MRIGVFCGANPGVHLHYLEAAQALGTAMARRGIGLVYGGASVGLMGAVADATLASGGEVFGVIPGALVEREIAHSGLTELHVVNTLTDRKARMIELSDAFIGLPGGFGTLDEVAEVLTLAQLGVTRKRCALLDVRDFYAHFIAHLDHAAAEGLIRPEHRALLTVHTSVEGLLDRLAC